MVIISLVDSYIGSDVSARYSIRGAIRKFREVSYKRGISYLDVFSHHPHLNWSPTEACTVPSAYGTVGRPTGRLVLGACSAPPSRYLGSVPAIAAPC